MEESSLARASAAAVSGETDQPSELGAPILEPGADQPTTTPNTAPKVQGLDVCESKPKFSQSDILKAVEVVERDSLAIAESFSSLFASLRLALSEVTSCSIDNMQCFADAAGYLQDSALDAATKGNWYINSCLRLNEEMKGADTLAMQVISHERETARHLSQIKVLVKKNPEEECRCSRLCCEQAITSAMRKSYQLLIGLIALHSTIPVVNLLE